MSKRHSTPTMVSLKYLGAMTAAAAWKQAAQQVTMPDPLHFTCMFGMENGIIHNVEDFQNLQYMRDTCEEAGIKTSLIEIQNIGFDGRQFLDMKKSPIRALFKLYPWEWMMGDAYGVVLAKNCLGIIEAPWKMILSNKALLPTLWEMYPNHRNLLHASFKESDMKGDYVIKPIFSREGANITTVKANGQRTTTQGKYGKEGHIYQSYFEIPNIDGNYPIIGSWVSSETPTPETELTVFKRGGRACGMGIREDDTHVTTNTGRFVPHYFV